ncbi:hypothetical protein P9112_003246 [Eukaryota sp. TZLM1-RC]
MSEELDKVALSYLKHFDKQFRQLFPGRRKLLLAPFDESNNPRVICSQFRPTQLPYSELYYAESAAQWVSDFINITPLSDSTEPPTHLLSPQTVLDSQEGDIFSTSILLCSLLIGCGYNAVVAYGYAAKKIAFQDQSGTKCPFIEKKETTSEKDNNEPKLSYKPVPRASLQSRFLSRHDSPEKTETSINQEQSDCQSNEPDYDPLAGRYVYSWVIVLPPNRSVSEPYFLDPATGHKYSPKSELFDGIESVFNKENIYINLQSCEEGCSKIIFDLQSPNWEPVFELDDVIDDVEQAGKRVVVPPPTSGKLILSKSHFDKKFHNYCKLSEFLECFSQCFTERHRTDGLVLRLKFKNEEKIEDRFKNRVDGLVKRVISQEVSEDNQRIFVISEDFLYSSVCGSLDNIIWHCQVDDGENLITTISADVGCAEVILSSVKESWIKRIFKFNHGFRPDGLNQVVETAMSIDYSFIDRQDGLSKTNLSFLTQDEFEQERAFLPSSIPPTNIFGRLLRNIALEFDQLTEPLLPSDIVALTELPLFRVFIDVIMMVIQVTFHRRKRSLLPHQIELPRLQSLVGSDGNNNMDENQMEFAIKIKKLENRYLEMVRELASEFENNLSSLANLRTSNLLQPLRIELSKNSGSSSETLNSSANEDFLLPFLPPDHKDGPLSPRSASRVKENYLAGVSRRLVEKAAIVEARLEKEKNHLAKLQTSWKLKVEAGEQAEEEQEAIAACDLRIQVATVRLSDIEKIATDKYVAECERLRLDPRMANLPELEKRGKKGKEFKR